MNYIFDLDGTLFDSYEVIVESALEVLAKHGLTYEREWFRKTILTSSLGSFFENVATSEQMLNDLNDEYRAISGRNKEHIHEMPNAHMLLEGLSKHNRLFVYTHRGVTTNAVLKQLDMEEFFEEVVTSEYPFPRKPSPDALNYLIGKYRLNREETFYVGDRKIDMECAKNAGLRGVLYLPEGGIDTSSGVETYLVSDLVQILSIE